MAEGVNTGGIRKFDYPRGYKPKLDEEDRKAIQQGYREAEERKKREKKNRMIIWIIIALIILLGLGFWFLKGV